MIRRSIVLAVLVAGVCAACGTAATSPDAPGAASPATGPSAAPSAAPSTGGEPAATSGSGEGPGVVAGACEILSEGELLELTGLEVVAVQPQPMDTIYPNACQWELAENSLVTLGVEAPGGRSRFDTNFKPFAEEFEYEPLEGVGDEGLISAFQQSAMAVRGDVLVDVQAIVPGQGDEETAARIVERVLANIGG